MKWKMQMFRIITILFFVTILTSDFAFAQQNTAKKDSTQIYSDIETYSKRSKFTQFMYSLVFRPVKADPSKKKGKKVYKRLIKKPYSAFEGKIIRNINIETLDPFGYSIGDTIFKSPNFLAKTGNKLHIKSQRIAIRNLLLVRQNQPFDSLLVKESERLVRRMNYIRDVSFFVKSTANNSDSVDIFIRELDIWSITPRVGTSFSGSSFGMTDKNFLGMGHEFQIDYSRKYSPVGNSLRTNYLIPNIKNTYISTNLHYGVDGDRFRSKSLAFDRPFFSPLAKWAAGIILAQQYLSDSALITTNQSELLRFKYNLQDFWAGNSTQIFKGNSEYYRTTNFISAVRFLRIHYLDKPGEMFDLEHRFTDENFYLASIGVSSRKFVQDKYIFKFGITEDVPIGKVFNLTGGYQLKNQTERAYMGARVSMGYYYPWGYMSSNFELGTFIHASKVEEGVITAGVDYFTGLIEIGQWKFRQFIKPQLTIGINRFPSDSLTLNEDYGLNGFRTTALQGTRRLLVKIQSQFYAPWNFIGFRFGPFLSCSFGMLGNEISGLKKSRVYSQIGFGVLVKNESLVLNTFQISISFYPQIPGVGQNVFKINSFSTGDFGFRDFEIGKPSPVEFR